MSTTRLDIEVPTLARVEGEGALEFSVENGRIEKMLLRIYEPPRFFEKFLEGRSYRDVPDAEARICGICPVAYQLTAVQAIEQAFGIAPNPEITRLRRLLYCGEWLQSHSLHIHALAAPDFLGCNNIIELAAGHAEAVRRGLRLQSLGNTIMRTLGGRSVHPVNVVTGGFHGHPGRDAVEALRPLLREAWWDSEELILWLAKLDLPDIQSNFTSVSLRPESGYPIDGGRICSDQGLDIDKDEYEQRFREFQVPHSTAFHSHLDDAPYLVGPLARINLNHDRLPEEVLAPLTQTGVRFPSSNMFHSVLARAIEIRYAIHEARRLIRSWDAKVALCEAFTPQAGTGFGATEAPRGLLWHRYELDAEGRVSSARIVPPTSQNQARIEADLGESLAAFGLDQNADALRLHAEKVIRNYDPCISCATHFLTLRVHRESQPEPRRPQSTKAVRLIAVGSPNGADRLAWDVARLMSSTEPDGMEIQYADRPGLDLGQLLDADRQNVIIDACLAEPEDAEPKLLQLEDLDNDAPTGSHGIGVATALALAAELGRLPDDTLLIALPCADAKSLPGPDNLQHYAARITEMLGASA